MACGFYRCCTCVNYTAALRANKFLANGDDEAACSCPASRRFYLLPRICAVSVKGEYKRWLCIPTVKKYSRIYFVCVNYL